MESKCQNGVENPQAGRLLTCLQSLGSEEDTETAAPSVVKIVRLIFVLGQDICTKKSQSEKRNRGHTLDILRELWSFQRLPHSAILVMCSWPDTPSEAWKPGQTEPEEPVWERI